MVSEKLCPKCRAIKPADGFYLDPSKETGLSCYCKVCARACTMARHRADPEGTRAKNRLYYRNNSEKYLASARRLRERVLDEYGGACKCCGETIREFLGVDHINNDGESHRREVLKGYGRSIYQWLKLHGYPKDQFQLLCHNCNMAKGLYGGCPHKGPPPGRRQKTTRWNKGATEVAK